jgi:hypothetical protein
MARRRWELDRVVVSAVRVAVLVVTTLWIATLALLVRAVV